MEHFDKAFMEQLQAAFAVEAQEQLDEIVNGLEGLKEEDAKTRAGSLDSVFRATHSLKGASRAVNKRNIETICQAVESLFVRLQREEVMPSLDIQKLLYRVTDLLVLDLERPERVNQDVVDRLQEELQAAARGEVYVPPPTAEKQEDSPESDTVSESSSPQEDVPTTGSVQSSGPAAGMAEARAAPVRAVKQETLRVAQRRLNQVMRESEELLTVKLSADYQVVELIQLRDTIVEWKKAWQSMTPIFRQLVQLSSCTSGEHGQKLARTIEQMNQFYASFKEGLEPLEFHANAICQKAQNDAFTVARFVESLQNGMRELLMTPFSNTLSMMRKVVRDLAFDQQKQIELHISGGEVEADRRILEGLKDPLLHLVRNSVDHGIEPPEERSENHKPPMGNIWVSIAQGNAGKVEIVIEDDGRGINLGRVRKKLLEQFGWEAADVAAMDDEQVAASIFLPGFSTAAKITEISGRGVGMSVVRERVESLGGCVKVRARPGGGTVFSILLPVAVVTSRGILVQAAGERFIVPTPAVERMLKIPSDSVKSVECRDTITLDGVVYPLESLAGLLNLTPVPRDSARGYLLALVVRVGESALALEIDEVLQEQEVLVKGLGPQLVRVPNISGVAVLGNGILTPILNVHDLIKSSFHAEPDAVSSIGESEPGHRYSILVVDDSITSRMLLKNVFEGAGYDVEVAIDGAAAFDALKKDHFDALITDVEMPRMNGFVLSERVRSDPALAGLPVVLVTSLASQEDRERGIEAGANAYIVKSSFDQSNLLSVVERLLETRGVDNDSCLDR